VLLVIIVSNFRPRTLELARDEVISGRARVSGACLNPKSLGKIRVLPLDISRD
jgi:hypothetical protein